MGSYNSLGALLKLNEAGNIQSGNIVAKDVGNSVIIADKHLVAVLGLNDVVIVENQGAILVCPRKRVKGIKGLVATLEEKNLDCL